MTTDNEMREREANDAPVHYGSDEASAWASGFNAALDTARAEAVNARPAVVIPDEANAQFAEVIRRYSASLADLDLPEALVAIVRTWQSPAESPAPRHVIYRDANGDRWKDFGDGLVFLIEYRGEHTFLYATPQDKATVEREYGPLVVVPASPEAGA